MNVIIHAQERKSLAMVATPAGLEVRIPKELDPDGRQVQQFISDGLARLRQNEPAPPERPHTKADVQAIIETWAARLGVTVNRVQFQPMRHKWGSMSGHGNLTLARDVVRLPRPLLEYVVVHELLHVQHPHHARNFKVALNLALPDWQVREQQLAAWLVAAVSS